MLNHGGVDLDGDHAIGALQEFTGERAAAGADFNDEFGAVGTHGIRNAIQDRVGCQKVLAEFARHAGLVA
jgi:hypothetical protein